ncbi:hypothetical protein [Mucilaginibacter agri]|uniref:Uncharacterized protein n=1 Tax=Mucilaginibacter agri TaxID=2695265 RepID=A0A965ZFY9_9SPHI|nr:hypothetical protein [Mucilaginibacter agri]NCD70230.1 hypothetical protein [Mucilaginibacter agri]
MNTNQIYWQPIINKLGKYLFAIPWLIFGIQHYLYATFVTSLVPVYMPLKLFWVYFTGTAMMAAAVSFIIDVKTKLTAWLLAAMLCLFILMLHIPALTTKSPTMIGGVRALQDLALMGIALILTGHLTAVSVGRIFFALGILAMGCLHFMHVDFITGKVPPYLPAVNLLDYIVGFIMVLTSFCIIAGWQLVRISSSLGAILLSLTLLYYIPVLAENIYNGTLWTGFMLNIGLTGGAFLMSLEREFDLKGRLYPGVNRHAVSF